MLKNYILVALRNMNRQKVYAFINIFGLSIGIAFCLLIILFVKHEYSYDKFHPNHENIFRASLKEIYPDGREIFGISTPPVLAGTLKDNFPDVEAVVRISDFGTLVRKEDVGIPEIIMMADPEFFLKFNFPLLSGNSSELLNEINSIVITEDFAKKYFADENPVGKTLKFVVGNEEEEEFIVKGVARNVPSNSSLQFNMVIPFDNIKKRMTQNELNNFFYVTNETYVFFNNPQKSKEVEAQFPGFFKSLSPAFNGIYSVPLQPISSIRLDTSYPDAPSDPAYSYILSFLAIMVLVIAIINFVTLSVGKSVDRAKEVGIRKVMGALRKQLVGQFWGEAIMISIISLLLGILIAELSLSKFNELSGKSINSVISLDVIWIPILVVFVVGALAGFYPAMFLSKFNPVEVLKGKMKIADAGVLKKSLIVFQFFLSTSLIICSIAMNKQLKFIQTKNLGFHKEQVIVIPTGANEEQSQIIVERVNNLLGSRNEVENISSSIFSFGQRWGAGSFKDHGGTNRSIAFNVVDGNFLQTMGIEIVEGRNFKLDNQADLREALIVNEAFVKEFGWDNALGKTLPGNFPDHQIVGVVKDFHFESLRSDIKPLMLSLSPEPLDGFTDIMFYTSILRKISIKANSDDLPNFMKLVEKVWEESAPGQEFNFFFVDEALASQYQAETRVGNIMDYSTFFALVIACLGLFSLATMIIKKRFKEIGIRKVLGASETNIAGMFSFEFLKLVLISILISIPFSILFINKWMENFVYQADIGLDVFLLASFVTIAVALFTVGFQAMKASLMNPVNSLRTD